MSHQRRRLSRRRILQLKNNEAIVSEFHRRIETVMANRVKAESQEGQLL
jgi:hypothetical protein